MNERPTIAQLHLLSTSNPRRESVAPATKVVCSIANAVLGIGNLALASDGAKTNRCKGHLGNDNAGGN
jgi:hypothetical protein